MSTLQYWFDHFAVAADWMTVQDALDTIQRARYYFDADVCAEMRTAAEHFAAGLPRPA